MRVGITGGSGFLGKEISRVLKEQGHTPIIIGRRASFDTEHEYCQTDYSVESLDKVLSGFEALIHLASIRGAGGNISDFHNNEIIAENIFKSCVNSRLNNIVYASTIAVYSDSDNIPWSEKHIPSPKTLYGVSKLACEHIGEIYHRRYGLNIKSLRIAQVLGEGERKGFMMNTFIDNAFNRKSLNVIGKSIAKREFVYIKDVAKAMLLAILKPEIHGSFNIGSNTAYTNLEIANIINKCFSNKGNITYNELEDEKMESSLMSSLKAYKVLGYSAEYSLEQALIEIRDQKLEVRSV